MPFEQKEEEQNLELLHPVAADTFLSACPRDACDDARAQDILQESLPFPLERGIPLVHLDDHASCGEAPCNADVGGIAEIQEGHHASCGVADSFVRKGTAWSVGADSTRAVLADEGRCQGAFEQIRQIVTSMLLLRHAWQKRHLSGL